MHASSGLIFALQSRFTLKLAISKLFPHADLALFIEPTRMIAYFFGPIGDILRLNLLILIHHVYLDILMVQNLSILRFKSNLFVLS